MKNFSKILLFSKSVKFYQVALTISIMLGAALQLANAQNTTTKLTIPDEFLSPDFKGNGNFNAIIFGNFTSNSGDVEGRLAVAGDFTINTGGYSVGSGGEGAQAPGTSDNLIVNGLFNNAGGGNWGLWGNIVYNTAAPNNTMPSLHVPGATITGGVHDHIVFSDNELINYYRTLSGTLAAYANTGTYEFDNYHRHTLTGESNGLNIFNIILPESISSDEIQVNIPANSFAIINILNSKLTVNGGSMRMNGADTPNPRVLFNFPNATSISLSHYKFLGSFLAPKASLNGNGGSINGQSIVGGHFDQQNGFEFHNFYYSEFESTLPVTLVKFAAAAENSVVNLSWATTAETNSSHFDIEHSVNGKLWNRIGTVSSRGESSGLVDYTFSDESPAEGENLYRLKMVDQDATFAYSSIQSVKIAGGGDVVTLYPNPASDKILVKNAVGIKLFTISDLSGRKVFETQKVTAEGIDCKNLKSDMYVVSMTRSNGAVESQKVLIRR